MMLPARTDLLRAAFAALFAAVICLWLLLVTGCAADGRRLAAAQAPGQATGAGATFTGPTNSAAPSTQRATRTTVYPQRVPSFIGRAPSLDLAAFRVQDAAGQVYELTPVVLTGEPGLSAPAAQPQIVHEETETTFGQHQDAAGILKSAVETLGKWGWLRWVGIVCILAGIAGWLWSVGNENGYVLVFLGISGCGVVFVLASNNPWWLAVLVLPLGFYAVQKMNLLKFPAP